MNFIKLKVVEETFADFFAALFKRKLLVGVLSYLLALMCCSNGHIVPGLIIILLEIVFLFIAIYKIKIGYLIDAAVFGIIFFLIGFFLMGYAQNMGKDIKNGDKVVLEGAITNLEKFEYSNRYTLKLGSGYFLCYLYTDKNIADFDIGDKVNVEGIVEEFNIPRNDGGFDAKAYYKTMNIRFSVDVEDIKLLKKPKFSFNKLLRDFRDKLSLKTDAHMPDNNGLLKAIMLGDKSDIADYEKELYQRGGISHILAISGLHVTNLSILLYFIFDCLRIPRKISRIIAIFILLIYAVFSGFSSSVVRAVSMFAVSNVAMTRGKNYDVPISLALSFFIYTLFYPYAYSSTGTILSYSAVFSIWLFSINYKKIHKLKYDNKLRNFIDKKLMKTIYMSLFLSFFSLPLVLYFFYTLPYFSLLVNLYVIPIMTALFMLAIAAMLFSFINGIIATILFRICSYIIQSFTELVDLSVNCFEGVLVPGKPCVGEMIFYYLTLFFVILFLNKVKRKYLLMLLMLIPSILLMTKTDKNNITMVDVDQGDCSIITTDNGQVFMIDCGSLGKNEIYKYTVEPYLLSNGISEIDYVFLSHSDMDHINGIIEYLEKPVSPVKIRNIVITPQMKQDEEIITGIIEMAEAKNIEVKVMRASDKIVCGDAIFSCLHPDYDAASEDTNDDSMVLELELYKYKVLFTGDIPTEVEEKLSLSDIDILKVSHHGSKTGTGEKILNNTQPEVALISCGIDNSYGHPAASVLENLKVNNVKTLISARHGQTRIVFRYNSYRISMYFP